MTMAVNGLTLFTSRTQVKACRVADYTRTHTYANSSSLNSDGACRHLTYHMSSRPFFSFCIPFATRSSAMRQSVAWCVCSSIENKIIYRRATAIGGTFKQQWKLLFGGERAASVVVRCRATLLIRLCPCSNAPHKYINFSFSSSKQRDINEAMHICMRPPSSRAEHNALYAEPNAN